MSDEKVVAKHAGKMADALVQAIRALREKVDTSVLKAAISRGDLKAALAAADVTKLWRDAYEQVMVDSLTQAAVGVLSSKHEAALSEAAPAGVEAHKRSARAKDTSFIDRWVEDHAGEEVARTSKLEAQTIKDAIRRVMADDGFDADDAAEMIKQTIGLTPQQAASLEKYREELLDEGDDDKPAYSQAEIKALLAERSDEMLAQRADTIAFNETQRAMSASQMQAWETLEEDGVIDEEWQKEWVVTSGERACDICAPMEGLQVGIKEEFSDGISMPPDPHIGCECMVILIDPADIEQNAEARARAEAHGDFVDHPFRGNQYTKAWHLTDKHDFKFDPDYAPRLNSLVGDAIENPPKGIFVARGRSPEFWMHAYGYERPYVAEMEGEITNPPGTVMERGREDFMSAAKTVRVLTADEYAREVFNEPGWVEEYFRKDNEPRMRIPKGYVGKPVSRMSQEERRDWERRFAEYAGRKDGPNPTGKREQHGESVGHPFRGNQWSKGEGEGDSQVSFEAQPSTATALLRGLHDAPMEMKHAYLRDAVKAIDVDDIAKAVGLKGAAIERAGFYDDPKVGPVSSPSIQFLIHDDGSDDTREKIEAFAASVGYLLRQDSVGYHRPVHEDKLPACNASEITLAEPVTPEILKSVDAAMRAHGEDSFALVSSEKGFRVLNFGSSDGTAFNRNVKAAVEAGTPDTITFEQRAFKSDGDLISNDWSKDQNGQGYISRNRAAGRPDVQGAVARASGRLEVVNRRWEALLKSYKRGEQHEAGDEDRDEVEVHGDFVGHPFRGNQWKDGFGKEDKERIPPGDPRRDENFKKWFGKSKVVDENGDPIVLYHGTHSVFDSFETDRTVDSGATSDPNAFMGAHLAQSADTASVFANGLYSGDSSGGNVVPVYVSIKNPLMVGEGRPPKDKLASLEKELESARAEFNKYSMARANDATITQAIHDAIASGDEDAISRALKDDEGSRLYDLQTAAVRRIMELKDSNRPMSESEIYDAAGMDYDKVAAALNRRTGEERMRYAERIGHKLKSALLSKGYDGVLYENAYENETGFATGLGNRKTWIAFHPEQIKSAIGNRGTFSPKDKRITHGDLPGHEFRGNQWTGGRGGGVPSIKPKDAKPKDEPVAGAKLAKTSDWRVNATSAFKVSVDKPVVDESKLSGVPKPVLGNVEAIIEEPVAPPGADQNHPEQQALAYAPDVTEDKNSDGVADFAVVGVPAFSVPPPPMIARLPNLNWNERIVEAAVCERVEKDIDGAVEKYNALRTTKGENGKFRAGNDDPKYFGTDDAKHVFDVWHGSTQEARGFGVRVGGKLLGVSEEAALERDLVPELQERVFQRRAEYNTVIHQAANAVAKRAFLKELDRISTLPPDQRSVLVTAGGCAAGKGYVLEKDKQGNPRVPEVYSLVSKAAAVWDSAGDQNGTENPWVAAECAKRGIEANFVYVHTDAMNAAEKSISRALKVGRQVDGRVLGDSYEYGAKNFEAFAKQHKGGKVYYVDNNTETPFLMDELPKTRRYKSEEIRRYAEGLLTFTSEKIAKALGKVPREARDRAKARLVRALTSGRRIFAGG